MKARPYLVLMFALCACGSSEQQSATPAPSLLPAPGPIAAAQNYAGVLDAQIINVRSATGQWVSHPQALASFYDSTRHLRAIGHHISLDGGGLTIGKDSLTYSSGFARNWGGNQTWVLADHAHTFTSTIAAPKEIRITSPAHVTDSLSRSTGMKISYTIPGTDSVTALLMDAANSANEFRFREAGNGYLTITPAMLTRYAASESVTLLISALNSNSIEIGGGRFLIRSLSASQSTFALKP